MIRNVTQCPYCRAVLAIDCQTGRTLWNPDGVKHEPCEHVACYWVCFAVDKNGKVDQKASSSRLWEFDRGEYAVNGLKNPRHASLTNYLCDFGFGVLPADLVPSMPHEIVGASAQQREEVTTGSGEVIVMVRGRRRTATLDGWAAFGPNPRQLLREISTLSDCYEV